MKISKLIAALQKYDGDLDVIPVKQIPGPTEDVSMLEKFGLELQYTPRPEIVGSVLDIGLVILKKASLPTETVVDSIQSVLQK